MGEKTNKRLRVKMDLGSADDQWRHDTVAAVVKTMPTSTLAGITEIAASVAKLPALAAALKKNNDTVSADKAKLIADEALETDSRSVLDLELVILKTLVEARSKSSSDIKGTGLTELGDPPPRPLFVAPEVIDIHFFKTRRGRFVATAHETGRSESRYAAQWSPEVITETSWQTLVGYGKSRTVVGPSGSKVWVRFARVRGQLQSEWSEPVLVAIP